MSAVFELTYRELPPDAARMYRLAAWIPERSFDAGCAAAAAGVDTAAAQSLLRTLERARLLDVTVRDGRCRFHDLVRLDRLRIADLTDLLRDAAYPFAAEGGPAPVDWLEAEHRTVLDVLRETARLGFTTEVWQLAEAFAVLW